jgi:drug/metabolite transporter (DMT)-like permease
VISQAVGFALIVVLVAARGHLDLDSLWIGAIGGAGGGAGLACFYGALARGTMSIVSPITACSAIVPVGLSLAAGERPAALALAGVGIAFAGALLASVEERSGGDRARSDAVVLAVGAALAIGLFVFFLGKAAKHGSVLSALLGARLGSLGLLVVWVLVTGATVRLSARTACLVGLVGLADMTANTLFSLASRHGLLAVVSVLGSLFPVFTVGLGVVVLGERLSGAQSIGVTSALCGVVLIAL